MSAPAPRTIRLWTQTPRTTEARVAVRERPPLGIAAWSDDAEAVAVWLQGSPADLGDAAFIATQIPDVRTLAPSTPVIVLGTPVRSASFWGRVLKPRTIKLERAPRCGALLARGYVDIGALADARTKVDVVWGYAPARPPL